MRMTRPCVVALAVVPLAAGGCRKAPPLTRDTVKAAVEAEGRFMAASPELAATSAEGRCKYFLVEGGKVHFAGETCRAFKEIGMDAAGNLHVVLPAPLHRRVLEVGVPEVKKKAASATVKWEWAAEELPEYVASCFLFEPRESMVLLELRDGKWVAGDILLEKSITRPYACPG